MDKEFKTPTAEIVLFNAEDIIVTSNPGPEDEFSGGDQNQ